MSHQWTVQRGKRRILYESKGGAVDDETARPAGPAVLFAGGHFRAVALELLDEACLHRRRSRTSLQQQKTERKK